MKIKLSDHFSYGKLLRFTFPAIVMMVFTSIYGVVDGFFVSNFAGKTAFSAVNFIYPVIMILGTVGFMFGTGGSAMIAKTLGEGDRNKANELFSLFVWVPALCGVVFAVAGVFTLPLIGSLMGASGELLENCTLYGKILLVGLPAFILQLEFQTFFATAEKPTLGLWITVIAGVTNMVGDALLVGVLPWGISGAAIATVLSQYVGAIVPLVYFARPNQSLLRLTKFRWNGKAVLKACTNGSSELMSNVSMSLVSMLYNMQLLRMAGENGVSAYGVLMYVSFVFASIFIGYSVGSAPIVGFHFGAENKRELKSLRKKSFVLILIFSVVMFALGELLASPFASLFVGYDPELFALTKRGFTIYSFSFLFMGVAIFASSFFTALSDGLTSALISFLRTLVFQIAAVLLLPLIWGTNGIWISIVAAEIMAVATSVIFLIAKRKKYGY